MVSFMCNVGRLHVLPGQCLCLKIVLFCTADDSYRALVYLVVAGG